ncbi:MAG: YbbR family protein [Ignavibacteria bacterium]|nr:MAG: YbbR family protein [Ignavibacteria bacterium]KAF0159886.1 MAG: YbbR family protein [Ignavibacteria bacterium]
MKKKIITISVIALLSIVFWVAVALSQEYITTIKVKIAFTDLPKNYSVGYTSLEESYLQIKGKGWELAKISMSTVENFYVSVQRKPGRHKKELSDFVKSNQWLFPSMQVIQIFPSQIEFDIDRISSKVVKISKRIPVNFRNSYDATSDLYLEPSTVEIFGSSILLHKIDSVKTVTEEFTDVYETISRNLTLEEIPGVRFSVNRVKFDLEVQKIVDKNFSQVPVVVKNVPEGKDLILFPSKIDLILRSGINKLGRLTNDSIKVVVDYWNAIKEETGRIEPEIVVPKFINIISVEPKKLEYIIKQY